MSTAFEYVNSINWTKQDLITNEAEEKNYGREKFIVNRALSYYTDTILYANEMNCFRDLDGRLQYDYFLHSIPKKKRFAKWGKKKKPVKNVAVISEYYQLNTEKARIASEILSDDQINIITKKLETGGVK